jgi:hypothetical protein
MGDPHSLNEAPAAQTSEALSTKKPVEYANKEMLTRIEKLEE